MTVPNLEVERFEIQDAPVGDQVRDTLVGSGDVALTLPFKSYCDERYYSAWSKKAPRLFINALSMGGDAQLLAIEQQANGSAKYRFYVRPGKESAEVWAFVYRAANLTKSTSVDIGIGWESQQAGKFWASDDSKPKIAISSSMKFGFGLAFLALILVFFLYIAVNTDALRDAPLPIPLRDAYEVGTYLRRLERARKAKYAFIAKTKKSEPSLILTPTELELLQAIDSSFTAEKQASSSKNEVETYIVPADVLSNYLEVLEIYKKGRNAPGITAEKIACSVAIGAAFGPYRLNRASFSLAKSQLALWFLFAVSAGVFLFVAKGNLLPLDGSILVLLGISIGTAGLGQVNPASQVQYKPSTNILRDLITDKDDSEQFHRYQAVAVNILLLIVGIYHLMQQLTYPVFDESWLYFLGISGTAYVAGKGLVESK